MAGMAMLKLVKRRGSLAALVTAGGVAVVVLAQRVVDGVVGTIVGSVSYEGTGFGDILGWVWGGIATSLLAVVVPFAVGVALSLWLLAPISPELRLAHVITRTLLAASAGVVLVLLVKGLTALFESFRFGDELFGFSMPGLSFDGVSLATQWVWVAQAAVMSFVSYSPIVVLAGVLLWIWLASHPMKHPVAGMLDEV